jgi:hypothetical protein
MSLDERAKQLDRNRTLREAESGARTRARRAASGDEKTETVRRAIEERRVDKFPSSPADAGDENAIGSGVPLSTSWVEEQVKQAFSNAGVPPTTEPHYIAVRLLQSYDHESCMDVRSFTSAEADPNRILAHVEGLGVRMPAAVAGTIARRVTLAILNRDAPKPNGDAETEFCAECGKTVLRGEACGCST